MRQFWQSCVDLGLDLGLTAQADQTYDNVDPRKLHAALKGSWIWNPGRVQSYKFKFEVF